WLMPAVHHLGLRPRTTATADQRRRCFLDFDFDPRDLERDEARDIDMPWIELGRGPGSAREEDDLRDRDEDSRDRDRDSRERDTDDPRDSFLAGLELPRGREREIVFDGDHRYELNGD